MRLLRHLPRLPKRPAGGQPVVSATLDSVLTAATVVLLLASLGGLAALISGLHIGLRVGDILVFKPGTNVIGDLPITAVRTGAQFRQAGTKVTCTMDPAAMVQGGGSLVVETKLLTKSAYRVHWAGVRTAQGDTSCGSSADLTMSQMDLQSLVNAIGGFSFNSNGNVL